MAGLSNSLCISQYSPSVDLMYDGELPVFSNKEECLKKIKLYLNDKNLLKEATEKFCKKSLEYEDSKYIDKIGNFLEAIRWFFKKSFKRFLRLMPLLPIIFTNVPQPTFAEVFEVGNIQKYPGKTVSVK